MVKAFAHRRRDRRESLDLHQAGTVLTEVYYISTGLRGVPVLIKNKAARRATGAVRVVVGGALMWLAPEEALFGVMLLAAGIALELVGITLEHRGGSSAGR